jgi:DNA-binding transcriptional MerR regulator
MRTVREVSKITDISVRTLHYYDEIGLLKPTLCSEAGYRLYDDKALETLQQILFFKELDMPLKDIKSILQNPHFDKDKTLLSQKNILQLKKERLERLIRLIDDIVKGENIMSFQEFSKEDVEELFQTVLANMNEDQFQVFEKKYGNMEHFKEEFIQSAGSEQSQENFKKVMEWYGGKDEMMTASKNPVSSDIIHTYQNRIIEIYHVLYSLKGEDPQAIEVKKLIGEYEIVSSQLYQMKDVKPLLLEMAKEFMENKDLMKANDEQYGEGASAYIGKAILSFYGS